MSELDIDVLIGSNLQRLRKRAGLTQKQLADIIGTTDSRLSAYESGRDGMGKYYMERVCKALKVDLWEFYVTEKTPIVTDPRELKALDLFRQADAAMIAEELVHYAEYRLEAAKKDEAGKSHIDAKRKIAKQLYAEAVKKGKAGKLDDILKDMAARHGASASKKKKAG